MLSSVLLLLVLVSGVQASYYGVVFTYSFGDLQLDSYPLTYDFKMSFSSCEEFDSLLCYINCSWPPVYAIDEIRGEWCQKGYTMNMGTYAPYLTENNYESYWSTFYVNWTENIYGIGESKIPVFADLRNRSDINKLNSSPRTTILPLVRVPSNCQRNINLLSSDPDGDNIRCRYAADSECHICTPPSVLSVSPSCTLSFSPTNSGAEGPYAVQLMMEDFPRQTITLTNSSNLQEVKTTSDAISKIAVQFVFRVDPAAPSCTEGLYLPRFLPPTPEHGALINANVNQTLEISFRAEATQAVITELLYSGPRGVAKSSSGSGNFTLTWTPPYDDGGLSHTLCFAVQAILSSSVYQSDLRCIIVTTGKSTAPIFPLNTTASPPTIATFIPDLTTQPPHTTTLPTPSIPNSTTDPGPYYVFALNAKISTSLSLENALATMIKEIKDELKRQGLPSDILIEWIRNDIEEVTKVAP